MKADDTRWSAAFRLAQAKISLSSAIEHLEENNPASSMSMVRECLKHLGPSMEALAGLRAREHAKNVLAEYKRTLEEERLFPKDPK